MALTKANLKTLPTGRHADSGPTGVRGLYLKVTPTGSRSWLGRTKIDRQPHHFGLGPIREVSLTEARDAWLDIKRRLRAGETPADIKGKPDLPTFGRLARVA